MERHGREDVDLIVREVSLETGKTEEDIARYYTTFWTRYEELPEHPKILERIEKGERRIARLKEIKHALD
eukprot:6032812-Prorocentrum_lima.AAC.1